MGQPLGTPGTPTARSRLAEGMLVLGTLVLVAAGGLQLSGTLALQCVATAPASTAVAPQAGSTQLSDAMQSLSVGGGPAAGVAMHCAASSGTAASCGNPLPAQPRPAISGNDTWINLTGSLVGGVGAEPPGMYLANMVYDPHDGYVVLFGGSSNGAAFLSNTWIYEEGNWTQLYTPISPSARYIGQMAYFPPDQAIVLFGGLDQSDIPTNDTWE